MSPREKYIIDCETGWSLLLSAYTIPSIKILLSWYRYYSAEVIFAAMEETAKIANRKGNLDSDSVGRIVSSTARKMQARQLAEGGSGYTPPFPERQ